MRKVTVESIAGISNYVKKRLNPSLEFINNVKKNS